MECIGDALVVGMMDAVGVEQEPSRSLPIAPTIVEVRPDSCRASVLAHERHDLDTLDLGLRLKPARMILISPPQWSAAARRRTGFPVSVMFRLTRPTSARSSTPQLVVPPGPIQFVRRRQARIGAAEVVVDQRIFDRQDLPRRIDLLDPGEFRLERAEARRRDDDPVVDPPIDGIRQVQGPAARPYAAALVRHRRRRPPLKSGP